MRFCEHTGCDKPVFGTDKKTRTGYCKNHQHLRTDISKETILQKAIAKQRKNVAEKTKTNLRTLATSQPDIKPTKDYKSKSELLREADRLFADFIKERDTINGSVYCPCCKGYFNSESVDSDGNKIINCMHFVDRDVYSLRYDEDAAHAGHSGCNKKQHYAPSGVEYQNFKQFLIDKFGTFAVHEMELQKRKINKIAEQDLKYVIEYYTQFNTTKS